MSQKLKVELQDENGNIYYLHTAADVVFLDDGTTVEAALEKKVTASGGDISNTKLATLAASSASFPVPAAGDAPKTLWGKVKKWQQDCLAKFANYVLTSAITNQYLNDTSKIPTAALMYLLKQEVNGLNSDTYLGNRGNISSRSQILDKGLYYLEGDKPGNGSYHAYSFGKAGIDWNYTVLVLTDYGDSNSMYSFVMQSSDGVHYTPTDYVLYNGNKQLSFNIPASSTYTLPDEIASKLANNRIMMVVSVHDPDLLYFLMKWNNSSYSNLYHVQGSYITVNNRENKPLDIINNSDLQRNVTIISL